jgi:hypothetical protein
VTVPLTLSVGESATVSVFRLLPDPVHLELRFDRDKPDRDKVRVDLGNSGSTKRPGFLEFDSPGARVVVQVSVRERTIDFEALPAGAYNANSVYRNLVPRVADDGDPRRFTWPPDNAARPKLPAGTSTLMLKVLDVGGALSGEKVEACLVPPLTEKFVEPNYGFLWWFFFWPAIAVVLACYAGYLVWSRPAVK